MIAGSSISPFYPSTIAIVDIRTSSPGHLRKAASGTYIVANNPLGDKVDVATNSHHQSKGTGVSTERHSTHLV